MPVDIVKVLKTQDENYIRTMRGSNAKVNFSHTRCASEDPEIVPTENRPNKIPTEYYG